MTDVCQTQRLMRIRRKIAFQRGLIALLDVGSSKVTCLILRVQDADPLDKGIGLTAGRSGFEVLGAHTIRSQGVQFGEVVSAPEAERAILAAIRQATLDAGERVDHVVVCVSGGGLEGNWLRGEAEILGETISDDDIAAALEDCDAASLGVGHEGERTMMHAHPIGFCIDERTGIADPRGQVGQGLSVDMHVLSARSGPVHNLLHCVERCHMEVAGLASASYASGLAVLAEEEQVLGAACIDMGAGVTGISVFANKHMIHATPVPYGGDLVTSDLSVALEIDEARAERIKTKFGGVVATGKDDFDMIPLEGTTGDYDYDARSVSRAAVIGIMRPRVEEILEKVRAELEAFEFFDHPSQRIVLTGGGSQTPGLDVLAERILGRQVRFGAPQRVRNLKAKYAGPEYAAVVGLSLIAARPQDEWWDFAPSTGRYSSQGLRGIARWFRDHF